MSEVRAAAVAGQFYPADAAQLASELDSMLGDAAGGTSCPKAIVAPHAGYIYSGPVAASVYARVRNGAGRISRVVLLGPSHRVGFRGIATSSADFFVTPLGQVPLDRGVIAAIEQLPGVVRMDQAHSLEHSLEVHLPFLQRCLENFCLVPLVVGDAAAAEVAAVIEALWGGPETLIVISSDLSHYLPYDRARAIDAETAGLIEARSGTLNGEQACGCRPLNGLLQVLRQRHLRIDTVDVRNSGDTAGTRDRVVGYGAWVVEENEGADGSRDAEPGAGAQPDTPGLSLSQRQQLLYLARSSILHALGGGGEFNIALDRYHPTLREQRGSFVTLQKHGQLRGCIGNLSATRMLAVDVASNAVAAAFKDHRFKPLQAQEFCELDLHISVLSPARPLAVSSREELLAALRPGVHGLILEQGAHRSTYLPSVWEKIPDPEQFVSELRAKAGLPRQGWSDELRASVYTTDEFS